METENLIHDTFPKANLIVQPLANLNLEAFQLGCRLNPALLLLVAIETSEPILWSTEKLLQMLERRPRKLLETLGYAPDWLRLLQKLRDPWLLDGDWLVQYLGQIRQSSLARIYRHLETVTEDVLLLAASYPDFVLERPGLLQTASRHPIYEDVSGILSALELLGETSDRLHAKTYDPDWLHLFRSRLEVQLIERGIDPDVIYPDYPIPPPQHWRQIRSLNELRELATRMNNCVMMYHPQLSAGQAYLYQRQLNNEPCCCLVFYGGGSAYIRDYGFPKNRILTDEEILHITSSFKNAGIFLGQPHPAYA